jgi:hypothetical protein
MSSAAELHTSSRVLLQHVTLCCTCVTDRGSHSKGCRHVIKVCVSCCVCGCSSHAGIQAGSEGVCAVVTLVQWQLPDVPWPVGVTATRHGANLLCLMAQLSSVAQPVDCECQQENKPGFRSQHPITLPAEPVLLSKRTTGTSRDVRQPERQQGRAAPTASDSHQDRPSSYTPR